jgi:hypothetical protein
MKYIVGFFRFWYDFIIGDCWQIAAGVVVVLGLGAYCVHSKLLTAELIPPVVGAGIVMVVVVSLLTTVREAKRGH